MTRELLCDCALVILGIVTMLAALSALVGDALADWLDRP